MQPLRKVEIKRYSRVSPSAFGLTGKKRIAVLRTSGAILGESFTLPMLTSSHYGSLTPEAYFS